MSFLGVSRGVLRAAAVCAAAAGVVSSSTSSPFSPTTAPSLSAHPLIPALTNHTHRSPDYPFYPSSPLNLESTSSFESTPSILSRTLGFLLSPLVNTAHAAAAAAAAPQAGQSSGGSKTSPSKVVDNPFVYPELTAGLARRQEQNKQLHEYMSAVQAEVAAMMQHHQTTKGLTRAQLKKDINELRERVNNRVQEILYGVSEPHARQKYVDGYGLARWTEEALNVVASFAPLVEIGAGSGHWQRALAAKGADIVAYDDTAPHSGMMRVGEVLSGDHSMLQRHLDRTLLLCYPPAGEMAEECLQQYKGPVLLYVGEGRGGVNASNKFFDALEKEWVCERVVPLDPFPECFERLFVMRRKAAHKK